MLQSGHIYTFIAIILLTNCTRDPEINYKFVPIHGENGSLKKESLEENNFIVRHQTSTDDGTVEKCRVILVAGGERWTHGVNVDAKEENNQISIDQAYFIPNDLATIDSIMVDCNKNDRQVFVNVPLGQILVISKTGSYNGYRYWILRGIAGLVLIGLMLAFSLRKKN